VYCYISWYWLFHSTPSKQMDIIISPHFGHDGVLFILLLRFVVAGMGPIHLSSWGQRFLVSKVPSCSDIVPVLLSFTWSLSGHVLWPLITNIWLCISCRLILHGHRRWSIPGGSHVEIVSAQRR
jgi:hypothetical protein